MIPADMLTGKKDRYISCLSNLASCSSVRHITTDIGSLQTGSIKTCLRGIPGHRGRHNAAPQRMHGNPESTLEPSVATRSGKVEAPPNNTDTDVGMAEVA